MKAQRQALDRTELYGRSRVVPDEMQAPSDGELMDRVQRGDRAAFTVLVDRHKHALVSFLTTLARDRNRAEELAQDTFVRLYERRGGYEERGLFMPYLFRIATNLLRSEERKNRRRELLLQMFSSNGARDVESPQSLCLRGELRSRLEDALASLPVQYRSPLVLREVEGWSYRDIARALSCEEGTVKSRIHRGRVKLKELLAPYWNGGR